MSPTQRDLRDPKRPFRDVFREALASEPEPPVEEGGDVNFRCLTHDAELVGAGTIVRFGASHLIIACPVTDCPVAIWLDPITQETPGV